MNGVTVEIQDVFSTTNTLAARWKLGKLQNLTDVSQLAYSRDDYDFKKTYRTNIAFRGPDGKFVSWKKLGPKADLSSVAPFPPKIN